MFWKRFVRLIFTAFVEYEKVIYDKNFTSCGTHYVHCANTIASSHRRYWIRPTYQWVLRGDLAGPRDGHSAHQHLHQDQVRFWRGARGGKGRVFISNRWSTLSHWRGLWWRYCKCKKVDVGTFYFVMYKFIFSWVNCQKLCVYTSCKLWTIRKKDCVSVCPNAWAVMESGSLPNSENEC